MRIMTLVIILGLVFPGFIFAQQQNAKDSYYCPMHRNLTSDMPGNCSICKMDLVKQEAPVQAESPAQEAPGASGSAGMSQVAQAPEGASARKIKFYRSPMNPEQTSPVPKKDEMGMEYIPVYDTGEKNGVFISSQRQQMIGVTTGKVQKRAIETVISAVGRVAYDPGLYVAQEEYLQALKTGQKLGENAMPMVKDQASSLIAASKQKLLLLGMNGPGIEELARQGTPQENLYLPGNTGAAWVYISIYEYEIGMVKDSLPVEITANAYPGQVFKGTISSLAPVVDKETRTLQIRAIVEDPGHKLKPEMFVNASIHIDLGEKLAVPESAVLDTGTRAVVYVKNEDNTFEQREIKAGEHAQGYYEVLGGVSEGESVVTDGNFLIDSETRMKSP